MDHGWCWQIDHEHHVNRGYVYASAFVSDADAEEEFRRKNPDIEKTRVVKFRSGCRARMWVGNVVAVGNAAGFVEPLEATALGMICMQSRNLVTCLRESSMEPTPSVLNIYNKFVGKEWRDIRDFLAVHYRFNTMKDTPFWRHCNENTPLHAAGPLVEFYREVGPSPLAQHSLITGLHQFGLDGYYAMLVGMKVPHGKAYQAPMAERERWERVKGEWVSRARNGLTVAEALEIIRDPSVKWAS
jgi:tryptophan halogenase